MTDEDTAFVGERSTSDRATLDVTALERRVEELGGRLLAETASKPPRQRGELAWVDGLLGRLAENEDLRVRALRFVDVLPTLDSDAELVGHLREYFAEGEFPLPGLARWGLRRSRGQLAVRMVAAGVRQGLVLIGKRFLGGSDSEQVWRTAARLRQEGCGCSLDLLGEATVSEAEAERYLGRYLALVQRLAPACTQWPAHALLGSVGDRPAPRLNLSVKVSSLYSQATSLDPRGSVDAIARRLRRLLRAARNQGLSVCIDMEHYDLKALVLGVFRELLLEDEFRDWPDVGIALQAYLRDSERDLEDLIAWAKARGAPVTVRLVRGAYWDEETVIARSQGWSCPVWIHKAQTDAAFERCLRHLLSAYPYVEGAVATHNPRSVALTQALAERWGIQAGQFEFQVLFGMADALRAALVRQGHRVRVYTPFGELLPGMAYLVRRLLENSSGPSFKHLLKLRQASNGEVLAPPRPAAAPHDSGAAAAPRGVFRNEPVRRFTDETERSHFAGAIQQVRSELGRSYPLIIGERERATPDVIRSVNPARPSELIGVTARAGEVEAEAAVDAARRAFVGWSTLSFEERAVAMRRAAAALRKRRDEFSAWEILEAGKPWSEADADVAEAIDFLEYYAQQALRFSASYRQDTAGEHNVTRYWPRGVGLVIPPWNFPLAILTGMLSAALVCGNTVVLKPSSQTPVIAARFVELLHAVGLPLGVVNFLPGVGAEVGAYLVGHPQIRFVAFTGSREVGTAILRHASESNQAEDHIKRVIVEMGGKNAIIVDADADPDDAVLGIVRSAFGYQGQKCSACSRAIIVGAAYEALLERLVQASSSLRMGAPEAPGVFLGPVIEAAAKERIVGVIERGCDYARLALAVDGDRFSEGWFVGPTIFADVPPDSELGQEEIFGPVLSVMQAPDFGAALRIANGTRYALTGGVYSRSPAHLEQARREFQVGNLYLNRRITGALVGRQPFGGFKMSGVGSKAGGPDYLLQFLEARSVSENTLRKGYAPGP